MPHDTPIRAAAREIEMPSFFEDFRNDPAKLAQAEEWVAGTFDGDHYTEVTLALYALHNTHPADLERTDVLARLYRLAKVEAAAMDKQLQEMADEAKQKWREDGEEGRSEARAASREAA